MKEYRIIEIKEIDRKDIGNMITIDDEDMDIALQDLIVKFYPEAELKEENSFIFDRYQDIKLQIVDLILDMGDEQNVTKV